MKIDKKLILENSKSLSVLYVEDDIALQQSTQELLLNYFASVDVANDGEEGLQKYKQANPPYDIVMSDIRMPKINGIDMVKKIKNLHSEQIIVFITAFDDTHYLHDAINLNCNGFLTKPMDSTQLDKTLFNISKLASDRKLLIQYYQGIESENIRKGDIEDASEFENSKDILKDLQTHKELISQQWMQVPIVQERLHANEIDVEFFRTNYAIRVVEYFLSVIQGENEVGNCPVVFVMLDFFKNKQLTLDDIFIICVHFKNSITTHIFKQYSFNQKVFDDINRILDHNFEGVIINFLKRYRLTQEEKIETKTEVIKEVKEEIKQTEHVNYIDYVIESDIYELQDLEEDIDFLAIAVTNTDNSLIDDYHLLGDKISRYGTILSNYPLFHKLGASIKKLGDNFLLNAEVLFNDSQRMLNISVLVEGFVNDLIVWRKEIFENNIEDPHFLDSSFFSNVDTIIMFIAYQEADEVSATDTDLDDMFF